MTPRRPLLTGTNAFSLPTKVVSTPTGLTADTMSLNGMSRLMVASHFVVTSPSTTSHGVVTDIARP